MRVSIRRIPGHVSRTMPLCCRMITRFNFFSPSIISSENSLSSSTPIINPSRHCTSCNESAVSIIDPGKPITISSTKRVRRVLRTEAQEALFDYLHYTRSFQPIDAEYISTNSPYFLKNLLSRIRKKDDARKALTKFFHYHPINEFEPFFESVGLSPTEFQPFLPKELMFLSDDPNLLDNFHVLCNYGIPRCRIGKIYMEAMELFRGDSSLLYLRLEEFEELGLSKFIVIKLVSAHPRILINDVFEEFVELLGRLTGLGFSYDWIGRQLRYDVSYTWDAMLRTLDYIHQAGLNDGQIKLFLKKNPAILFESSGRRVLVLIGLLLKFGVDIHVVLHMFLDNPKLLSQKFSKNLWESLAFFSAIGMSVKAISHLLSVHVELLGSNSLLGPKTVLKRLKISKDELCRMIEDNLERFICVASITSHYSIEESAGKLTDKSRFLSRLGYVENTDEMLKAWKRFRGRGDELQGRFDCLVEAGLNSDVVVNMIRQAPSVLNQRKEVLKKKVELLSKVLGHPLEMIAAFPMYLAYDVERITCRFSMYAWLVERGAARPMLSLSSLLACSDNRFVKYFVNVHPEGPKMWESLRKS